ncbi:MAG: Jag N-terminal domain-containing protein [Firmicutes bacterium]|nr:Jag N-terminal domain-containing protein [Bacillota bacterium]
MEAKEFLGKTIDEAINTGLMELGVTESDVDVEIVSQGGFLKKAKVLLTVKETVKKQEVKVEEKREVKPEVVKVEKPKQEVVKKQEVKQEVKQEAKPQVKKEEPKKEVKVEKKESASGKNKYDESEKFLKGLLTELGNSSTVTRNELDNKMEFLIDGEDIGVLIGKSGTVMKALEYLTATIAINCRDYESKKRVTVNVGAYREKREEILQKLAEKTAEKVKATGRYIKLEPMNSYERRVIHAHLQTIEGVKTFSSGQEPKRCICIAPADSDKKKKEE